MIINKNFESGQKDWEDNLHDTVIVLSKEEQHRVLDQLVAEFIACTGVVPSEASTMDLMEWSCKRMRIDNG